MRNDVSREDSVLAIYIYRYELAAFVFHERLFGVCFKCEPLSLQRRGFISYFYSCRFPEGAKERLREILAEGESSKVLSVLSRVGT